MNPGEAAAWIGVLGLGGVVILFLALIVMTLLKSARDE